MHNFFETKIESLNGLDIKKTLLLKKELRINTYGDLIEHFPFRYEDKTKIYKISELNHESSYVQIKGKIRFIEIKGVGRKKRMVAYLVDDTAEIELVWFKGIEWIKKTIKIGIEYIVYGKPTFFGKKINMAHPTLEIATVERLSTAFLYPVYSTTELMKKKFVDSKTIAKLVKHVLTIGLSKISETLPKNIRNKYHLFSRNEAIKNIHYPTSYTNLEKAKYRLKFEELFYIQLQLLKIKVDVYQKNKGLFCNKTELLKHFYEYYLPFGLTEAQKKVSREIYDDLKSGFQMNRLLQGDVGSGKTIVALISLLIVIDNKGQGALVTPTEILAQQHFKNITQFTSKMGIGVEILTGSTKVSKRKIIHEKLLTGEIKILVGTHALLEDKVQFKNLGLAIIDEQHRFGVAQRSELWKKNNDVTPHILVMTATPIPRTLAMTLYGDLEISTIDELPKGRKSVKTIHQYDNNRLKVNGFIKEKIKEGRQVYIVYPLIEKSETQDLKDLMDGYESITRTFPNVPIGIIHGKMKSDIKEFEMTQFIKNQTKILVATTVIEVGVDVPNASVMIIENAERFGLSQLHQLRGRVGRGMKQSYCVLMSSYKLTKEARFRLETMVRTNDGFEIADADLKLRGPGDLLGTQQSGVLNLLIADLSKDGKILKEARATANEIIEDDGELEKEQNLMIRNQIEKMNNSSFSWSRIS